MALHPMLVKYLDGLEALTDGRGFDREHEQARLFVEAACNAYKEANTVTKVTLTDIERDTILAALRLWQATNQNKISDGIIDIATNGGSHAVMSDADIDELCEEKINVLGHFAVWPMTP